MLKKTIQKILERKLLSTGIAVVVIVVIYFGGKAIFGGSADFRYLIAQVYRGDLVIQVSGSGQVLASNQLDIKPKTSGDIVYVGVKTGQEVYAGQLIALVDTSEAEKGVRDAEINLEKAKLSLQKIQGLQDGSLILRGSKDQAYDDLKDAYDSALNSATAAFLDLPGIGSGLRDLLFSSNFGNSDSWNMSHYSDIINAYGLNGVALKEQAHKAYDDARIAFDAAFNSYKSVSLASDPAVLDKAVEEI